MQQATIPSARPINFKKERSFSAKLDATFAFLNQNFKPIGKNILYIAGPFALLAGLFYGIYQSFVGFSGQTPFENATNLPLLFTSLAGFIFFSFIAGPLVAAITLRHIRSYVEEGNINIGTGFLWKTIWKDYFSVLGSSFFIGFAFMVCLVIAAIPAGILAVATNPFASGALMFVLMLILMLAMCGALLLYPIRSMEGKGVFSATSRLFRIISGKWLSTIGLVIVTSLIQFVMSFAFAIPTYIIMFLQAFHDGEINLESVNSSPLYTTLLSLFSGLSMVGSFGVSCVLFIAISFQYFNLIERKYSSGLMERMEDFGKQKPDLEDYEEQY